MFSNWFAATDGQATIALPGAVWLCKGLTLTLTNKVYAKIKLF
jgi:hypothetical protein